MVELFANSGDPDQMPHSAASDLGLHCLPVTLLRVSRLQWVNPKYLYSVCIVPVQTLDPDQTSPSRGNLIGNYSACYSVSTYMCPHWALCLGLAYCIQANYFTVQLGFSK